MTFHRIKIPVKVYEPRTGELLTTGTVQISGTSCPSKLFSIDHGDGPPSDRYVDNSKSDVGDAFRPLIKR
ncbi:hypothetical protein LHJ74_06355 [Streptomyces sp. N2-109]|uniref:Uncharacterized protein n=1 Tax=Streptomyces gossypii TaxID=2883101 RepID=A0ABT2JPA0_9ACTN|nr:hypothetical protein [Streptomyces gossypii]MCT2589548.1 hypothetical protein [Streptomyces gossypii]